MTTRDRVIRELHERHCTSGFYGHCCCNALEEAFDAGAAAEREEIAIWLESYADGPGRWSKVTTLARGIRARAKGE